MTRISEYKKREVRTLSYLIKQYPVIGAVNMENLPAPQLQNMRHQTRENIVIRMSKRRLINIALEQSKEEKKGIEELKKYLKGMPALIFTKENPFKLSKFLEKNKSMAPAKAGQLAPNDIIVNAGPTPFAPGPIIGELAQVGIKTNVEGGKISIKEDSVVVKKGEKINAKTAEILARLGIKPMDVGLDLIAVYENGIIFTKDVLTVDEKELINKLSEAGISALNLAINSCYATKGTIELLITKAFTDAKSLALQKNIICDLVVENLLGKAEAQMLSLKDKANIVIAEKRIKEIDETDKKVAEIVKKTKEHAEGKEPTASKLLEEVEKEVSKNEKVEVKKKLKPSEIKKVEEAVKQLQKGKPIKNLKK